MHNLQEKENKNMLVVYSKENNVHGGIFLILFFMNLDKNIVN